MNNVGTFERICRMPYAYSDLPDPLPTIEPICLAGDVVVLDGPWRDHQAVAIREVSDDRGTIWVDITAASDHCAAVGVHRVIEIRRDGADPWTRPARTPGE